MAGDNTANSSDHSLSASIDLDFTEATASALAFETKIDSISLAFAEISDSVKALNGGIGYKLKQILDAVDKAQTIELTDVDVIREKIEGAVALAMANADIKFKKLGTIDIELGQDDFEKLQEQVKDATIAAFKNVTVEPFEFAPITLTSKSLKPAKEAFEKELRNAINNKMGFDFKYLDKEGKEKEFTIGIEAKHMKQLMDSVRDKIISHLSQPDTIDVVSGWDKPIKISNKQLDEIYTSLSARIADVAASITIDTDIFDKVGKLKIDPIEMKKKIADFVRHMELVTANLNSLNLNADETDMKAFIAGMKGMKVSLIKSITDFLSKVDKQLETVKHPKVPDLVTKMTNLQAVIDTAISAKFDGAIESVLNQMGIMRMDIDGKEILVPVIKRLEQALLHAAQNVIPDGADPAYAIDLQKAQKAITDWAGNLSKVLSKQIDTQLKAMTATWTGNNQQLLEKYAASIAKLINFQPVDADAGTGITIEVPVAELKAKLGPELQRVAAKLAEGIQFNRQDGVMSGIELSDEAIQEALKDIRETIVRQAVQVAAAMRERGLQTLGEPDMALLDRALAQESRILLDAVVDQTKRMVQSFTEGVRNDMLGVDGGEDAARIHGYLKSTMAGIVSQFMEVLKDIVHAFTFSTSAFKTFQETAAATLNSIEDAKANINAGTDLNVLSNKLMEKTYHAVFDHIMQWVPNIHKFKIDIDNSAMKPIITAIQQAIENALKTSAAGVQAFMERSMNALFVGDRSVDFVNMKKAVAQLQGWADIPVERYFRDAKGEYTDLDNEVKKYGVKPGSGHEAYGYVLQDYDLVNIIRKVFMMDSRWVGTGGRKKPDPDQIARTIMHEIGHLMHKDFMEKYGTKEDGSRHGYKWDPSWTREWIAASHVQRPDAWKKLDNAEAHYGQDWMNDADYNEDSRYYNSPQELFADAFSLVQSDFEKSKKLMPTTAQMMKDLVPKIDLIDPDLPESTLDASALSGIPLALNRFVKRAADLVVDYMNGKEVDMAPIQQAIDLMEEAIQGRIKETLRIMTDEIEMYDWNPDRSAALMRELGEAINAKVLKMLTGLSGIDSAVPFDFQNVIDELKESMGRYVRRLIDGIEHFDTGEIPDYDHLIRQIDERISELVVDRFKYTMMALQATNTTGDGFRVDLKSLDPEVRKIIAEKLNMTLAELRKQTGGYLTGQEGLDQVAQANIEAIFRKFHQVLNAKATETVDRYKTALEAIKIEADLSSIPYMIKKFDDIQIQIVDKVREMLDMQFHAMAAAIRQMTIVPHSLGYTPPASFANVAAGAVNVPKAAPSAPATAAPRSVGAARAPRPRTTYTGTSGGGRMYYPVNDYGMLPSEQKYENPGGDTRSFSGAVRNTLRYMTAGMIMAGPGMLVYDAWNSAKESDYEFTKAQVNLTAKGLDDAAKLRAGPNATPQQIAAEEKTLGTYVKGGELKRHIQNIGIAYGLEQPDAFAAYQEATRKYADPHEALAVTRGLARIKSIENVDVQQAASGLTAMGAQWQLSGFDMEKVADMIIATSNVKFTSAEDLLDIQKRSGNLFMQALYGKEFQGKAMNKQDAIAASLGLSALYTESTGRSGAQGGTMWKSVITSPLSKSTSDYLTELSQSNDPRLQALNPFIERTGKDGQKVYDSKNGLEILLAATDAQKILDPKSAARLNAALGKDWHKGDLSAIQSLINDMDKINGSQTIQAHGGVTKFFNDLKDNPSAMADEMSRMMAGTWNFRTTRLKSTFQATSADVLDNLKGEFGEIANYLSGILMGIRNHADLTAEILKVATKALIIWGGKVGIEKIGDMYTRGKEDRRQKGLAKDINRGRYYLNEEGRAANLNRMIVSDYRADIQNKLDKVNVKRGLVDLDGYKAALEPLDKEYAAYDKRKVDLEHEGKTGTQEYRDVHKKHQELEGQRDEIARRMSVASVASPKLDAEAKTLEKQLREVDRKFKEVDRSATSVNTRMDAMDMYMKDAAFDSKRLTGEMIRVDQSMGGVGKEALGLKDRLQMIRQQASLTDKQFAKLTTDVDKLNAEFDQGRHSADQYIRKMRELERLHRLTNMPLSGRFANGVPYVVGAHQVGQQMSGSDVTGGKPAFGSDVMSSILGGTALGVAAASAAKAKKPGLLKRVFGGAKQAQKASAPAGRRIPRVTDPGYELPDTATRGNASEITYEEVDAAQARAAAPVPVPMRRGAAKVPAITSGSRMAKLGKLAGRGITAPFRFAASNPAMLLAAGAYDIGTDIVGPAMMDDTGQKNTELSRLDDTINGWNTAYHAPRSSAKHWVMSGLLTGKAMWDDVKQMAGGVTPSWSESDKIQKLVWDNRDKSPAEVKQIVIEAMGIDEKTKQIADDQTKQLLEDQKKYLPVTGDLETDANLGKRNWNEVQTFEEGQLMVQGIEKDLALAQGRISTQNELDKAGFVIRGIRDDSKEMRDLMKEFFTKNIQALNEALNGKRDEQGNIIEEGVIQKMAHKEIGKDAYNALEMKKLELQALMKQMEAGLVMNDLGKFDETNNLLGEDLSRIQVQGDISKANLLLGGATDDSAAVKSLDKATALKLNARIEDAKGILQQMLTESTTNEDMKLKIQDQMLQLTLEQKNNLVAIKKAVVKDKSTFNLPEGVAPMTYWESKVKDGTHKNVAIGSGDNTVNITIAKMSGDENDLQKMAKVVSNVLKKDRGVNISQQLGTHILTGMANNHRRY